MREAALWTKVGYRLYLRYRLGAKGPFGSPTPRSENDVLKTSRDWERAKDEVRALGLPLHADESKNWDSLTALHTILKQTDRSARILDAGSEVYSMILPWLFLYGYKNLTGINLVFNEPIRRGPISLEYGDLTQTKFEKNTFDVITCLSVIEHGVNLQMYFREMHRILKPGGRLITSTDYYDPPIQTQGLEAYGSQVKVFSRNEILNALDLGQRFNLSLTGPINLDCQEKAVRWNRLGLQFTFVIFTLKKEK